MIISRTPFRISFFGGGTDYPSWFQEHGGHVLATSINHYSYITCRKLPPFFDHRYRLTYSKQERVSTIAEIEHPVIRECLAMLEMQDGFEIHHDADLPARTGLGSSSSFTVGLLHTLYTHLGIQKTKHELALEAIQVEQSRLGEAVGNQDQTSAAYGGFNHIQFQTDGNMTVSPVNASPKRLQDLNDHLLLFFTGISRFASDVAQEQVKRTSQNTKPLNRIYDLVNEAKTILEGAHDLSGFGDLLHETWTMKRQLSDKISNSVIDDLYALARKNGAIGGKLLGAGAGGFFLVFAKPEDHHNLKQALHDFLCIPFNFETNGTEVIFNESQQAPL